MNNLKNKINEYIQRLNIATSEFEKRAGVGNAVVNRILDDTVKNPSIETILKIVDLLNCSLDEVFARDSWDNISSIGRTNKTRYNNELFRSICLYVTNYIELYRISSLDLETVNTIIEQVYKHCIKRKLEIVDKKFTEKLIKNYIGNSSPESYT